MKFLLLFWLAVLMLATGCTTRTTDTITGTTVKTQAGVRAPGKKLAKGRVAGLKGGRSGKVQWGVYDPGGTFAQDRAVDIEHVFIYWQDFNSGKLKSRLDAAARHGRTMMVTVEPYTKAANWRDGSSHLFSDITSGKFDRQIHDICGAMSGFNGRLLIRWGHEMEDPNGRYPWASRDREGYKAAYRYFVTTCRHYVPRAAFVWSPKGESNLAGYYPGSAYVDYVGVALWGLQAMDRDYFGHPRGFAETFKKKYQRVAHFSKPVLIAELGVSGDGAYRRQWFDSLSKTIRSHRGFPRLRAVVYFNDKEPYHWPNGYGSPDWRIKTDWFANAKQTPVRVATR